MLRVRDRLLGLLVAASIVACGQEPTEPQGASSVLVDFIVPSTARTLVLEVSGPGIGSPVVRNLSVGTDSTARGAIVVPPGSGRRFVVTAVDSIGIPTHRADTTISLAPAATAELTMSLRPLTTRLGIVVVFGTVITENPD